MWTSLIVFITLLVAFARPEPQDDGFTFPSTLTPSTVSAATPTLPTGSYVTYTSQETASTKLPPSVTGSDGTAPASSNATSTTNTLLIVGSSSASTGTATGTSALPTNTQPCNGYPEFCSRRYMNITQVCAHNSAFVRTSNAASNQAIGIIGQLNDGVRMIQGETHYVNGTVRSCHTNCDILDAGPLVDELTTVRQWVEQHPYDVLTILLVNSDFIGVNNYTSPIMAAGLGPYLYQPPKIPMHSQDWPTFQEMILSGKRVVIFMDYQANRTEVPYILDEFSQMWETPFSPTDISFPCNQERPPGLNAEQQALVPYLANHNLNLQISFGSFSILIPNFPNLNQVNSDSQNTTGALGLMASQCNQRWGRPPAWLLVDFYNYGNTNGSVFEVAAQLNNVTYRPGSCCGQYTGLSGAAGFFGSSRATPGLAMLVSVILSAWSLF